MGVVTTIGVMCARAAKSRVHNLLFVPVQTLLVHAIQLARSRNIVVESVTVNGIEYLYGEVPAPALSSLDSFRPPSWLRVVVVAGATLRVRVRRVPTRPTSRTTRVCQIGSAVYTEPVRHVLTRRGKLVDGESYEAQRSEARAICRALGAVRKLRGRHNGLTPLPETPIARLRRISLACRGARDWTSRRDKISVCVVGESIDHCNYSPLETLGLREGLS